MRLRNIPEAKGIVSESPRVIHVDRGEKIEFLDNDRPLHLEIGMGKGAFITEMAKRHPDTDYIGVERYESVLLRAIQKIERMEDPPENLRFLSMDAAALPELLSKGDIDKIYLNFSDPWPKARHANRRLTSARFLEVYEKILPSGGIIEFKTDNRDLFDFSLSEIKERPGWEVTYVSYDLHRELPPGEENIMTEYEEKFSLLGNKICKLVAGIL